MYRLGLSICGTLVAASFVWAATPSRAAATSLRDTVLSCDFDEKPLNQVIGTGGPSVNEPVDLDGIAATVRAAPLATRCLEIADTWGSGFRAVRFEFLDGVEVTSGVFEVSMTLQFEVRDFYHISLRPQETSTPRALYLLFTGPGNIYFLDLDTSSSATIGSYSTGVDYELRITMDLDARTYDVQLGSELLLHDEGLGDSPVAIGSLWMEIANDPDSEGTMYVDDVVVSATAVPTAMEPTTWSALKARWR